MSLAVDNSTAPKRNDDGTVATRYKELEQYREPFLRRARECAAITIPSLLPRWDDVTHHKLPTPYQSVGAQGVNNLAAKLLLTLFPPNGRFFRLIITSFDLDELVVQAAQEQTQMDQTDPSEIAVELRDQVENEVQEKLSRVERAVVQEYESKGNRATDFEALKHLVTVGNVLRFCPLKKNDLPRIFPLSKYVVRRDPEGRVLEIITKEGVSAASLDPKIREACKIPPDDKTEPRQSYALYTYVARAFTKTGKARWEEYQELNGEEVPGSRGYYKIDKCPWLALRWSKIDGEDYGRGHVEDFLGDLISLNGLKKAVVDGSIGASKLLFLLSPAATLRARDLTEKPNGSVVVGNPNDVSTVRVEKANDFSTAASTADSLTRSLGQAFLLTTSIQRTGERVTAEEIRRMANELEMGLGGNYSTLSLEYQLPVVELTMFGMQKQKRLPPLPDEVQPTILTGVQALGRNADLEREMQFYQALQQIPLPPEEIMLAINPTWAIRRLASHLDIEARGLLRTKEEIEEIRKAQQEAALAQTVAPQVAQALTQGAEGSQEAPA